jgi:hypothetical protein
MNKAIRSPLRWVAATLLLVTAAVHLPLVPEHLEEAPYAGVLFVLLAAACIALAVVLVLRDTHTAWTLSGAVVLLALVAFLASRTVGLPQLGDDVGNWGEPLGFPAVIAELLTAVVAAQALTHRTHTSTKGMS